MTTELSDPTQLGAPHPFSRRQVLSAAAGTTGLVAASQVLGASPALAGQAARPRPIPGGFQVGGTTFHVLGPASGEEPSTITDFTGVVAITELAGTVTRTNTRTGRAERLPFAADMRGIAGNFVATDGKVHRGVFGFV